VKSVGDLNGLARTLATAFSVRAGAITDDDLDARVTAQPVGKDIGGAIIEQIDGSVCFEIKK
jgi:hypothetical protein